MAASNARILVDACSEAVLANAMVELQVNVVHNTTISLFKFLGIIFCILEYCIKLSSKPADGTPVMRQTKKSFQLIYKIYMSVDTLSALSPLQQATFSTYAYI